MKEQPLFIRAMNKVASMENPPEELREATGRIADLLRTLREGPFSAEERNSANHSARRIFREATPYTLELVADGDRWGLYLTRTRRVYGKEPQPRPEEVYADFLDFILKGLDIATDTKKAIAIQQKQIDRIRQCAECKRWYIAVRVDQVYDSKKCKNRATSRDHYVRHRKKKTILTSLPQNRA